MNSSLPQLLTDRGWLPRAFWKCKPIGLIYLAYLGGFLLRPSPAKTTLVTILFHAFFFLVPVWTFNISLSQWHKLETKGVTIFLFFHFCSMLWERMLAQDSPSLQQIAHPWKVFHLHTSWSSFFICCLSLALFMAELTLLTHHTYIYILPSLNVQEPTDFPFSLLQCNSVYLFCGMITTLSA